MSLPGSFAASSRRGFFNRVGSGMVGMALAELFASETSAAPAEVERRGHDLLARRPPRPARARAVIQLFMHGGPAQMDLLDHKPSLAKYEGKSFPGVIDVQQPEQSGGVLKFWESRPPRETGGTSWPIGAPTPTNVSSTACSARPVSASAGAVTGWTWPVTPTPSVSITVPPRSS